MEVKVEPELNPLEKSKILEPYITDEALLQILPGKCQISKNLKRFQSISKIIVLKRRKFLTNIPCFLRKKLDGYIFAGDSLVWGFDTF